MLLITVILSHRRRSLRQCPVWNREASPLPGYRRKVEAPPLIVSIMLTSIDAIARYRLGRTLLPGAFFKELLPTKVEGGRATANRTAIHFLNK